MPSNKKLSELSLKEKIGQMVMFGFKGTHPDSEIETLIQTYKLGNIIYFKRNVKEAQQVFTQNKHLQSLSPIPLLIGIDQEGGLVTAIDDIVAIPGAMAASAANDPTLYSQACEYGGKALRQLGINMNFAPVADVNNNPHNPVINARSYGDDVKQVKTFVNAAIDGYQKADIISTAKHFPGHGDTEVDSHLGLPVSDLDANRLETLELAPFKSAIANNIPSIMTAHILLKTLDDTYPATLSPKVMQSLLRDKLNFKGILITDLLSMHAIKDHYSMAETIKLAANAGNDILLYDAPTLEEYVQFLETFEQLVINGDIPMERLDESVERILKYKTLYDVGTLEKTFDTVHPSLTPDHAMHISQTITNNALTLVRDNHDIPVHYDKTLIVFPDVSIYSLVDNYHDKKETFGSYLTKQGHTVNEILLHDDEAHNNVDDVLNKTHAYNKVIVFTHNAILSPPQKALLTRIDPDKLIMVTLRAPYDVTLVHGGTLLCAYEATPNAFKAIHALLEGRLKAQGVLPVTFPTKS